MCPKPAKLPSPIKSIAALATYAVLWSAVASPSSYVEVPISSRRNSLPAAWDADGLVTATTASTLSPAHDDAGLNDIRTTTAYAAIANLDTQESTTKQSFCAIASLSISVA